MVKKGILITGVYVLIKCTQSPARSVPRRKALINNAGKMAQNGNPVRFNFFNFNVDGPSRLSVRVQEGCYQRCTCAQVVVIQVSHYQTVPT